MGKTERRAGLGDGCKDSGDDLHMMSLRCYQTGIQGEMLSEFLRMSSMFIGEVQPGDRSEIET